MCAGAIALFSGSIGGTGGQTEEGEVTTKESETRDTAKPAKIGESVRDGTFAFTVTKVRCGVDHVGDEYVSEKAQGQFCLVSLSVRNIREEAQLFTDEDQTARGTNGEEYDVDTEADLVANEDADVFFGEINPGNTLDGVLVFDIPTNAKLASVRLHDSAFSEGATVNI